MKTAIRLLVILMATPAMAQDATVSLPLGDWLAPLIQIAGEVLGLVVTAAAAWALARLPAPLPTFLRQKQVDAVLAAAVRNGVNAVAGAAADKKLSFDVGSKVVAEATNYAVSRAPDLVRALGGADAVRAMILARINLDDPVALK